MQIEKSPYRRGFVVVMIGDIVKRKWGRNDLVLF